MFDHACVLIFARNLKNTVIMIAKKNTVYDNSKGKTKKKNSATPKYEIHGKNQEMTIRVENGKNINDNFYSLK